MMTKLLLTGALFALSLQSFAVTIKIATLVPKGTSWAKTLKNMAKEIKKETKGDVKFKIYYGGTQGDEPDVLRKTRIGQLHGGVFTGKVLGDIFSDVRSVEVPFNFYNDETKALKVLKESETYFNEGFNSKGFTNLGFYGIGKVYVVSTKEVKNIDEMKGVKMWAWEGDEVVRAMMESLGLVSVPLSLPDVMSSLSTGMIEAAYAPPLGILALQWQSKVKYLIDFPTAYSIGALLVSNKRWKKVSAANKAIVQKIAGKYVSKANSKAVIDNQKALDTLKEMGVKFVTFSKKDLEQAETIRKTVLKKLEGKVLSNKIIKKLELTR
jgi:TRAP-type C4-dicarboxylate transport system substrate-binding protein